MSEPALAAAPLYSLQQVARLSSASVDQLRRWDKNGLLPAHRTDQRPTYTFQDVIAARAAVALLAKGVRTRRLREAVEAVRSMRPDGGHPLAELRLFEEAGEVVVRLEDALVEPRSGQALLALELGSLKEAAAGLGGEVLSVLLKRSVPTDAQGWLERGLDAEERGEDGLAESHYKQALEAEPDHAGALLNLGNVSYRRGALGQACELYRAASRSEPEYAEAWYNLANALDDLGHIDSSVQAYETALRLEPELGDAHFNLALLWEKLGQRARARTHWERFLALDGESDSARIAHRFLESEEGEGES
jgi:tetratricopeptide (TPR) repeat protein